MPGLLKMQTIPVQTHIQKLQEKRKQQHQLTEQILEKMSAKKAGPLRVNGYAKNSMRNKKLEVLCHALRTQHMLINHQEQRESLDLQTRQSMSIVVEVENRRHLALKLHLAHSYDELKTQLTEYAQKVHKEFKRFTAIHERFIFKNEALNEHYIFADIHAKRGMVSVILLDSLNKCNLVELIPEQLTRLHKTSNPYYTFADVIELLPVFDHAKIAIIPTGVQSSSADCLSFCLSFALKAYKEKELFEKWHGLLKDNKPLTTEIGNQTVLPSVLANRYFSFNDVKQTVDNRASSLDATSRSLFEQIRTADIYREACKLLPASFLKHTNSSNLIQKKLCILQQALFQNRKQTSFEIRRKIRTDMAMLEARKQQTEFREIGECKREVLVSIEYKYRALLLRSMTNIESTIK